MFSRIISQMIDLSFLGNPLSMESLYDRDDNRSVYCFPGEIYASRANNNNPYTTLKTRSCHSKTISSRLISRHESSEYKKFSSQDEDKPSGLTSLRRKSLSSCDLFHVTSKTLTSPFDEIQNWLNNKRKSEECLVQENLRIHLDPTNNNQEKMTNDEFELIQLALIHLTTANRQFLYVILFFLVQCVRNKHFCSNDTNRMRVRHIFH